MKAKSCLEKLQDSSIYFKTYFSTSEQLSEVSKAAHSTNKIDFEKAEPTKQELRQKKEVFPDSQDDFIRKGISKYG